MCKILDLKNLQTQNIYKKAETIQKDSKFNKKVRHSGDELAHELGRLTVEPAEAVLIAEPVLNLAFHYEISMLEKNCARFRGAHSALSTPSNPKCEFAMEFTDPRFQLN